MMLERQREGIAKAKAENRYMGRRPSARLKADEKRTSRIALRMSQLGAGSGPSAPDLHRVTD
jgi:DNA invertase Pin-like site-specific DNA recombinase